MGVGETIQSSRNGMFNQLPDGATERIVIMFATASSSRTAVRYVSTVTLALLAVTANAWAASPAAGEFSAADTIPAVTAQVSKVSALRRTTQLLGADAAHRVNGELPPAVQMATPDSADARAAGRVALRARTLQVGDASL